MGLRLRFIIESIHRSQYADKTFRNFAMYYDVFGAEQYQPEERDDRIFER